MKSYKKILSAVMALTMLFSIAGCAKNENSDSETDSTAVSDDSTGTDANAVTGDSSAAESGASADTINAADYFDNTPVDDMSAVVMTINGNDVTLAEYRYYFLNLKYSTDYGDETYWNGTAYETDEGAMITAEQNADEKLAALKNQVDVYLKNNYTVEAFAAENNISLTDEEIEQAKKDYEADVETYKAENSLDDAGWTDYLNSIFCTEDLYMKSVERRNLEYKLIRSLYEDDFKANVLSNYVMAKHVLLSTTGAEYDEAEIPEGATDEEIAEITAQNEKLREEATNKLKEEKKVVAEEVLAKANSGENFDDLITEYNEDPGEVVKEDGTYDGYLFTKGEMVEQFETAAFALGVDEVSDIVETDYGYHIIKRVDISDEYLEDNIVDIMMTNDTYYQQYSTAAQSTSDSIEIEYNNDIYDKINVISLV